ncbi:MAG: chloride channel protein, partial [candidate division NC10 bacterium]|nr:chloride channel protein [candidate division NC10 bacterium]
ETIQASLEGERKIWYAFILKAIFTGITLNFGGSGGIVTPMFFIGATAGTLFAELFNVDSATFAAIGLVSVLAGGANAPIAASILAMEYFGTGIAPYAALACVVSFVMTGHRSVYPSQILAIEKSKFIEARLGEEVEKTEPQLRPGSGSVRGTVVRVVKVIKERIYIIIRKDE